MANAREMMASRADALWARHVFLGLANGRLHCVPFRGRWRAATPGRGGHHRGYASGQTDLADGLVKSAQPTNCSNDTSLMPALETALFVVALYAIRTRDAPELGDVDDLLLNHRPIAQA